MTTFIEHGVESSITGTQFGALNALPHLFVREELRAENLGPLVSSLGQMLVRTQTDKPHIFYPTYVALERINSLIGSKRFYQYLFQCGLQSDQDGGDISKKAVTIYETVQKRAPSPQVYIANMGMTIFFYYHSIAMAPDQYSQQTNKQTNHILLILFIIIRFGCL